MHNLESQRFAQSNIAHLVYVGHHHIIYHNTSALVTRGEQLLCHNYVLNAMHTGHPDMQRTSRPRPSAAHRKLWSEGRHAQGPRGCAASAPFHRWLRPPVPPNAIYIEEHFPSKVRVSRPQCLLLIITKCSALPSRHTVACTYHRVPCRMLLLLTVCGSLTEHYCAFAALGK